MKHNFYPYLNSVFIESGTYGGDGVRAALNAGFKKIISIELSKYYYDLCCDRFKDEPRVQLYFGDSILVLPKILKGINERCTFWLDGHFCQDMTACGIMPVPLMEELKIIARHSIKNHTLLLDDMRLLRTHDAEWKDLDYGTDDVEKVIRSINPKYKICYIQGFAKQDILVAEVE